MLTLAHWLAQHRDTLLPRWIDRLESVTQSQRVVADAPVDANFLPQVTEQAMFATSLYNGLIQAADGVFAPLNECLRLLRPLRIAEGEAELNKRLDLTFQLRHVLWDHVFSDDLPNEQRQTLLEAIERVIEYATYTLAEDWVAAAATVRQQLQHSEQFARSLADSVEQADQIALQLHMLNALASELASSLDADALIDTAGSKLVEVLGATYVAIWLRNAEGTLTVVKSWGESACGSHTLDPSLSSDVIAQAATARAPVFVQLPTLAEQGSWYQAECAALAVPLLSQDVVTGMIVVQDAEPELRLSRSQQEFVHAVASQSAIALQNAQLYGAVRGFNAVLERGIAARTSELQLERDMLSTLNEIALEVSSTLDLDLLLENSLHALAQLLGVDRGSVMLIEDDTEHLVDRAVIGRSRDQVGFTRFPIGQGIAGWVAQQRKPALVPDVTVDPRWVDLPSNEMGRKSVGAMALVPLIVQGEVTGVLSLSHDAVGYFTDDHMRLLTTSAGAIALGINNARLYDEIMRESIRKGDMLQKARRAESQSNAILQSLSDGVIVCDIDGLVLTANPAAERVLSMALEDLLIMPLPELLQKLLPLRVKEMPVEKILQGDTGSYAIDFQRGYRTIRVSLDPVSSDKEQVMGAVAVFRDITREVESERLKDEFIGTVSHELRTPMTTIKGFLQLLVMGSLGPINAQQHEFLTTINVNSERMISIINDLLDLTKIEAGSVELEIRSVHVAEALGNVVMEVQSLLKARQHELTVIIPPGLPMVRTDAKRFDQILHHLMTNAIKYTPVGGRITVHARHVHSGNLPSSVAEAVKHGEYVQIDVIDNGIGIAIAEQEQIFARFHRPDSPLKIEAGGTGLGLSLVRPLVKLFGGQIWLNSILEEGSTFSFIVPAG